MDALPIKINLGLDKFTKTISDALGLTAKGIKKNADAKSYAAIKEAETNTEVELLKLQGEDKIAAYILNRDKNKFNNVENIISKAENLFDPNEQVSDEPVEKEWMNRFLNIVEEISDESMSNLWAQLLAGEIKRPKSYSLRSLEVLRNMTKEEAVLLVKSSRFLINLESICTEDFALNLEDSIKLEDIGIICGEELNTTYTCTENGKIKIILNPWLLINIYAKHGSKIVLKNRRLTKAGTQIIKLIQEQDCSNFLSDLSKHLKQEGADRVTVNKIISWKNNITYTYIPHKELEI